MPSRSLAFVALAALAIPLVGVAQAPPPARLLEPARVYDGAAMHEGWGVVVRGRTIEAAGPLTTLTLPAGAERVPLAGLTLMPGLVEGHSHLLLHPYNETTWNDQVLREPLAYRVARATVSARDTLMAGITTVRDLGTEGAGYADVGLKQVDRGRHHPRPADARVRAGDGGDRHATARRASRPRSPCRRAPRRPTASKA